MPHPMPDAICVRHASWRLSPRRTGLRNARTSPWRVLRWLLLGIDGAVAGGRRNERALDRPPRTPRVERVTSMGRLVARLAGVVLIAGSVCLFLMGMA